MEIGLIAGASDCNADGASCNFTENRIPSSTVDGALQKHGSASYVAVVLYGGISGCRHFFPITSKRLLTAGENLRRRSDPVKLSAGYFLLIVSWVVKGYLKITGQWTRQDEYRRMAAEVRRLSGIFHLKHYAIILDEGDARPCSECGDHVYFVVEPHELCSSCWYEALKRTQKDLREAIGV